MGLAMCYHLIETTLELEAKKGKTIGLSFLKRDQLLVKMLADDSLLFLKIEVGILRNAFLQVI